MQTYRRADSKMTREKVPLIRKARPTDVAAIHSCVCSAYRHYILRIGKSPGPMLDDYAEVVKTHLAFVAETEGQVVGVLVLMKRENGILLDNIAVLPEQQRKGLGRQLLRLAESEAREEGFAYLDLYTHECMVENVEWYKKLGYREFHRRTEKGYSRIYMRKSLLLPQSHR